MQRGRAAASPRVHDDAEGAQDFPETEAERWARVMADRRRRQRGTALLQPSMRRVLNHTYERDASARTIQDFVRAYVLPRRSSETAAMRDRRRDNATIRPRSSPSSPSSEGRRTPRGVRTSVVYEDGYVMGYAHRGGGIGEGEYPAEDDEEEDDDGRGWWGEDGGRRRRGAFDNYLQDPGEITRSTAPLTESQASLWADFHSSSTSTGSSGRSLVSPREDPPNQGIEYEVYVWQSRQHALELAPCTITGFPSVANAATVNISLPGMWNVRDGDLLVSINDFSTHPSEMPFSDVELILESGVRPAILRFRRPRMEFGRSESGDYFHSRDRAGLARAMSMASVRSSSGGGYAGNSSSREETRKQRERAEASLCYVIFREDDESLGLRLTEQRGKPYLEVGRVHTYGAAVLAPTLAPRVSVGDMLLSINDWSARQASLNTVVSVLKKSPRPLVLTFRRTTPVFRTYDL